MPAFEYTALDLNGKAVKGIIESDSDRQVRSLLREKQLAPLTVESAHQKSHSQKFLVRTPSLSSQELCLVTRQLSILIASGLPIAESVKAVSEHNDKARVIKLMLAVRSRILEGHSLASSLADFPKAFPKLFWSTVAAGEKSGHLDLVLARLADYTEAQYQAKQKIQLALLYPLILLIVSLAIVSGLLAFVVPKVVQVFVDSGQELPMLTQGLIALSNFITSYGLVLLLGISLIVILLRIGLRHSKFRMLVDRFKLRIPFISRLVFGADTARFVSTLSILSGSGVVLVDGMKIASEVVSNGHIRARIKQAVEMVVAGSSLRNALAKTECFPPMMLHMIGSGEASGKLDAMLAKTAVNQERELENSVTVLVKLFEPFMLLVMGVVVMLIVLSILLPILNLNRLVL
jgi:general secretion pathway protein F